MTIVIITLQPILKLPPLWNANYLGLSYPIILQIVWVVPSILSSIIQVTWPAGHMTIAAIFDNGNLLISVKILVCSEKSACHCYIISCMQILLCDYGAIDIQGTV